MRLDAMDELDELESLDKEDDSGDIKKQNIVLSFGSKYHNLHLHLQL